MRKIRSVPLLPTLLIIALLTGAVVWLWVRSPRFVKEGDELKGGPVAFTEAQMLELCLAQAGSLREIQELRYTNPETAVKFADLALRSYSAVVVSRFADAINTYQRGMLLCYKADALAVWGRLGDAAAVLAEAVDVGKENIRVDLHDSTRHYPLMAALGRLASHYFKTGDTAQARDIYDQAYARTAKIAWIEGADRKKDEAPHYKFQSALTLAREAGMAAGSPPLQLAKLEEARRRVEEGLRVNESAIGDHWRNLREENKRGEEKGGELPEIPAGRVNDSMQYVMGNRIHGHCVLAQVLRDIADLPQGFRPATAPEDALNAAKQALLCFIAHEEGRFKEDLPDPGTFELPEVLAWAKEVDLSKGLLASPHLDHAQVRREDLARAIILLASCYRVRGEHDEAREAVGTAIDMAKEIGDARISAEAIAERGRILEAQGMRSEAIGEYEKALNEAEDIVLVSALPALERHAFAASYRPIYDSLVRLLLERRGSGDIEEAFRYVEAAKSRLFLDMIGNHDVHPRMANTPFSREERRLRRNLQLSVMRTVYEEDTSEESAPGGTEIARSQAEQLDAAVHGLSTLDPEWYSMRAVSTSGLPEIQKLLRDGEVLIEYHIDGPTLYIFAVSRSTVDLATVDLIQALATYAPSPTQAEAEGFVPSALTRCVNDAASGVDVAGESDERKEKLLAKAKEALRSLYGSLLAPIEDFLPRSSPGGAAPTLIIVPDRMLHFVPFAALVDEDGGYLIERYATVVVPSASIVQYLLEHGTRESDGRAIVIASPLDHPQTTARPHEQTALWYGPMWEWRTAPTRLPGAEKEADAVRLALRDRMEVLVHKGEEASEDQIRSTLKACVEPGAEGVGPEVLHFSCHCEFDHDEPMFTMLVLGATVPDTVDKDGAIEARDVMNWRLAGTDVVTLNVCESLLPKDGRLVALSKLRAGGELVGLSRAFLYAGAASVVATLAEIPDEPAAALMPSFYKYRYGEESLSKSEALRRAQLDSARENSDSLDWASYVLVGDWR